MSKLLIGHTKVLSMSGSRAYVIGVVYSLLGSLCFSVFYILCGCGGYIDVGVVGTLMGISISVDS